MFRVVKLASGLACVLFVAPAAIAQMAKPSPPGAPIARRMDIWPGAIFVCVPMAAIDASFDVCKAIEAEAVRLASAGAVRLVIGGQANSLKDLARAAGFDRDRALEIVAQFDGPAMSPSLSLKATSRTDANPGVTTPTYKVVFTQSATLPHDEISETGTKSGRIMLRGFFEMFLRPIGR